MIRLPFFELAQSSDFLGADSGIECWALWRQGATLWAVLGGQSGGWALRERVWVHDRLKGGPHEDKVYSGYWGQNSPGPTLHASDLAVSGMTLEKTAEGFPLARLANGIGRSAQWGTVGQASTNGAWRVQLHNAATGALLMDEVTGTPSIALPTLATGTSALLRVRIEGAAPAYQWPPPSYKAISGEADDFPARFEWHHPTRGKLFYDPRFRVGARPYNPTDKTQKALLDGEAKAIEDGTARKVPEWVSFLLEFDASGAPVGENGEWAALRVVVGASSWVGDSAVHAGATTPALWRVPLDPATLEPTGAVVPWVLDPTLRCVGALEIGNEGQLLIGGAIAGRSGPVPCLYEVQAPSDASGDEATTDATLSLFICECCLPLGKAIRGIASTATGLRAVSPCDSFRRDVSAPLFKRLVPSHPGGRNSLSWSGTSGENYVFSTEGGDFATSAVHQKANGYIVIEDGRGQRTGAPLAKQLDSCLAIYGGRLWGVEEWNDQNQMPYGQSIEERLASHQALGVSLDGAQWERLVSWQIADFDAGPIGRAGSRREGAALWVFGTWGEGSATIGRAMRLQGSAVARNIGCDFFIQRVSTFRHNGEEWMAAVGLKRGAVEFDREQFVLLSKGDPARVVLTWDPEDETFCAPKSEWEKWGFDWDDLPPYLVWTGECWLAWFDPPPTDGTPYLEKVVGSASVCYHLHGTMPYNPDDIPGLEWEEGRGCWEPEGPTNADEALNLMPDGTKLSLCVLSDYTDEIGDEGQILEGEVGAVAFYGRLKHPTLPRHEYAELYPWALWLRSDANTPLQLAQGQEVTPQIREQLTQFDQRARLDTTRHLATPAQHRVEALLLLAPGWELKGKNLKVRG